MGPGVEFGHIDLDLADHQRRAAENPQAALALREALEIERFYAAAAAVSVVNFVDEIDDRGLSVLADDQLPDLEVVEHASDRQADVLTTHLQLLGGDAVHVEDAGSDVDVGLVGVVEGIIAGDLDGRREG